MGWLNIRKQNKDLINTLPEIGYIAFKNEKPIAITFLRVVDGHYAYLDPIITNPKASVAAKKEARPLLFRAVMEHAKKIQANQLLILTSNTNDIKAAVGFGFIKYPHVFLKKKI